MTKTTVTAAEVLSWPKEALTRIRVSDPTGNVEEWQEAQTAWDWVRAQAGEAREGMSLSMTRVAADAELAQVGRGVEVCSRSRTGGEWQQVVAVADNPG